MDEVLCYYDWYKNYFWEYPELVIHHIYKGFCSFCKNYFLNPDSVNLKFFTNNILYLCNISRSKLIFYISTKAIFLILIAFQIFMHPLLRIVCFIVGINSKHYSFIYFCFFSFFNWHYFQSGRIDRRLCARSVFGVCYI